MKMLFGLIDTYLEDARAQHDELNRAFAEKVPYSSRPFFEEVIAAFAASLDVIQIIREELIRLTPLHEASPREVQSWEVVTVLDADGRIMYESEGIAEQLGYLPEERIGQSAWDWLHPEDLPEAQRIYQEGLRGGGRTMRFDVRLRHRNGPWRRIRSIAHAIRKGSEAVGYVARSEFVT